MSGSIGNVVITGASAGVGRATARKFARSGAQIALLARGRDGLEATRKEVEALGAKVLVALVDIADAEQIEAAAERIEAELGKIDIWINNAMTSVFSPVKQMTPAEFKRVTEVTITVSSFRSAARSPIVAFPCNRLIVPPNTRFRVFAIHFVANCSTTRVPFSFA